MVQARQGVDFAAVAPIQRADGFHLLGRQDFIAVDIEHPIVARQTGGQVFHRAEADKVVMVHSHIGEAAGNVERTVGGAVVEHDDFVKCGQCGQAGFQVPLGVFHQHGDAHGDGGHKASSIEYDWMAKAT